MGCDIHMYVEVKGWSNEDAEEWQMAIAETATYGRRNYGVFAALANVRNYESGIRPISLPRGLPGDVSGPVRNAADRRGRDGHSYSWLLLSEALGYDWGTTAWGGQFAAWAQSLTTGPTRMANDAPESIRLVFWFDN